MSCHGPINRMPAPIAGATTGTRMKIIMMKDIALAIARPAKRSRTMATAITRAEPAATPWSSRPARWVSKSKAATARTVAAI